MSTAGVLEGAVHHTVQKEPQPFSGHGQGPSMAPRCWHGRRGGDKMVLRVVVHWDGAGPEGCDLLVGDARRARLQLQLFHLGFSQLQGGEDPMGSSLVSSGPLQLHREERLARGGVGPLSSAERSSSVWSPCGEGGGQREMPRI